MRKKKFLMIIVRATQQRIFLFKAKSQIEAMKIADKEFKKWKLASSYEVYELTKERISEEPNLILPFMTSHVKKVVEPV